MEQEKLLNINDLCEMLSISRATIYNKLKEKKFPKPIKLTRINLWKLSEINKWLKNFS